MSVETENEGNKNAKNKTKHNPKTHKKNKDWMINWKAKN